MDLDEVLLASLEVLTRAQDGALGDHVLDGSTVGGTVGEQTGEFAVDGLHVVDDGHVNVGTALFVAGDHIEVATVLGSIATEEQLSLLGNTAVLGTLELIDLLGLVPNGSAEVLDDVGVQALVLLVALDTVHIAFLAVLTTIVESDIAESEVLHTVEVLPEGLAGPVGFGVVQVQGTLGGPTADGEGTDEDTGLGRVDDSGICSRGAFRSEVILHVVDGELHLGQGVLQVEGDLVLLGVAGLHQVDEGEAGLHHVALVVDGVNGRIVTGGIGSGHTEEEVNRGSGIGVHHILDDGVAGGVVLVDGDDVELLNLLSLFSSRTGRNNNLTRSGLDVGPGGIGEEGHIVNLVGDGGVAVLVGPVLDGLILPDGSVLALLVNLLVVHEVGLGVGIVLLTGGVVGENTEAKAVLAPDVVVGDVTGSTGPGQKTTLGVDIEVDAALSDSVLLLVEGKFFLHLAAGEHGQRSCSNEQILFHKCLKIRK